MAQPQQRRISALRRERSDQSVGHCRLSLPGQWKWRQADRLYHWRSDCVTLVDNFKKVRTATGGPRKSRPSNGEDTVQFSAEPSGRCSATEARIIVLPARTADGTDAHGISAPKLHR